MDQRGASILCCGLPMHRQRNTNDDPSHLGTRASGPQVRRMVGTHWEAISAVMVRETLAGKVCVSAMSWAGIGLQRCQRWCCGVRLARPHLPPGPLPLPHGERKGGRLVRLTGRAILGSVPLPRGERKGACGARGERHSPNPSRAASGAARSAEGTDRGTERWPPNAVAA